MQGTRTIFSYLSDVVDNDALVHERRQLRGDGGDDGDERGSEGEDRELHRALQRSLRAKTRRLAVRDMSTCRRLYTLRASR